ncbi:MAG: hypothetical protein IKP54_00345 [Bacteroidales bacterium]|nr:hypothetical protein [Bacteroidales bacterium]
MSPDFYNIILQGLSMLNAVVAGAQTYKDNPDEVKRRANAVKDVAQIFQDTNTEEFKPEAWLQFRRLSTQLADTAQQLAEECDNPEQVMRLTSGNLKQIILQIKDVASKETERPHGLSVIETIKAIFKK